MATAYLSSFERVWDASNKRIMLHSAMYPRDSLPRFRKSAKEHLEWCERNDIPILGGHWNTENPITGLLLAACANPTTVGPIMCALLNKELDSIEVTDLWWPTTPIDIAMNFRVGDSSHFLALEHKHVKSVSNDPGYKTTKGSSKYSQARGKYSQIESVLREIDHATHAGETEVCEVPFDIQAERHLIVLDARGRLIDQIFEPDANNIRNSTWTVVSYADFASRLRSSFQENRNPGLVPILGQLFAGWR